MQQDRRGQSILKKARIFQGLPSSELAPLVSGAKIEEKTKRRVIYMPGDPGNAIYFIGTGRVKISRVTPDGKELTLSYRSAGELFGELCLLDGGAREEMAEVVENARMVLVPREPIDELARKHVKVAYAITSMLINSRRLLERKIEDLVFKDVNAKLAELLLKLAHQHGVPDDRGTLVSIKVTHQEMANLIGSTRETVSLALSQFKRKGLITSQARRVIIRDIESLRTLV